MSLLTANQVDGVVDAISSAIPDVASVRPLLLAGLPATFTGYMPTNPTPLVQLRLDINRFNDVARLADGTVPLAVYLSNAERLVPHTVERERIAKALELVTRNRSGMPTIEAPPQGVVPEVIVQQDDTVPYAFVATGLVAAKSVAKLMVPRYEQGTAVTSSGEPVIYLGTGWLIRERLLVTNHHVINAREEGQADASEEDFRSQGLHLTARFDFDSTGAAGRDFTVESVVAADRDLDFALLRLSAGPGSYLKCNPNRLVKAGDQLIPVNVIQHPHGLPKRFGIRNNLVYSSDNRDLKYFTDTEGGSSGSPVLDDSWQVVGLHRGAHHVNGVNFQGKPASWVNLGTQVAAIREYLTQKFPAIAAEIG